jgi:hypothetical protein
VPQPRHAREPAAAGHRAEPRRPSPAAAERDRLLRLLPTLPEAEAALVRAWHGLPAPEPDPGGSREPHRKGPAMSKLAAAANEAAANDDEFTALRAQRGRIEPGDATHHWSSWSYMTSDPVDEVLKPGYFEHCANVLRRHDRISFTCLRDCLAAGDKLGPAVHGVLIVTRCEQRPGQRWDIRVQPLAILRELPNVAPRLDATGKPLPTAA